MYVLLPPANEVWRKVIFLHQFVILFTGGACVVAPGGHAWLLWGGVRGCSGGHAWLLQGGRAWLLPGGHAWLLGGVRGFIWGACVVLFGGVHGFIQGHAWFYLGGVRGFIWGGVRGFFSFFGYNEIRSMSGRYASYWNAFLLEINVKNTKIQKKRCFFSTKREEPSHICSDIMTVKSPKKCFLKLKRFS